MHRILGLDLQKSVLNDTMWDLIVDTLGRWVIADPEYVCLRKGTGSCLEVWIHSFSETKLRLFQSNQD